MPNVALTNITPPRVPLLDARTGLISREWYRFFLNLFNLTGGGQNTTSITDLQVGPPAVPQEDLTQINIDIAGLSSQPTEQSANEQLAELNKAVQGVLSQPDQAATVEQIAEINKALQALALQPQPELGSMAPLEQANLPWVTFNNAPSPVPTAVGSVYWDGGTTLGVQATTNVLMRVGESEYVYVKASSAVTKGQLCYHTGAVGASGVITVAPTPINLSDPDSIVGVAAESIALNGFGLIQISGALRGFNTTGSSVGETWADGDPLYYNPAYVGSMTKTKPSAPKQKTYVGEVTNAGSGSSGSINVRIVPGSVLGGTDSNVQFSALSNGDLIQYDSALQYWKNVPASTLPVGTATNLAGGLAGSVPYQTAPGTTTFLGIGSAGQWLGSSGTAPQWNSPAALTKTDDTNVTLTLGGSASTALLNAASLTLGWTGQLAVSRGGTGVATATANYVFAGPTSGGAAAPSFRALVAGDIPSLSYVTSVGATAPITSTGGLTPTIGVTAAALTKTDDTNVTLTLGGSPTTALLAATSLTLGWTGQLAASRGGTGFGTYAVGDLLYANTTSTLAKLSDVATGNALISGGVGVAPSWGKIGLTTHVSGTLATGNGGTGLTSFTANGVVYASSTSALTTGSALTFDGTNFATTGTASATKFIPTGGTATGNGMYLPAANTLGWSTNGTQAMTLDSSGNLGVGTTTPAQRINIKGPGTFSILQADDSTGAYNAIYGVDSASGGAVMGTLSNHPAIFRINNAEKARIDTSGNMGIGTTTPALSINASSRALTVYQNTTDGAGIGLLSSNCTFNIVAGNDATYISNQTADPMIFRTNATEALRIDASQNFYVEVAATTASAANMFLDTTTTPSGQVKRSTSSLKYKTDVKNAVHGLAELLQLRPVTYKGKNDGDKVFGGLIAEEVDAVGLTEFVQYAEDGSPDALAYGNMVSLLVKAVQEQQAVINDLRARVAKLETK